MTLDEQQTKIRLINPALKERGWTLDLVAQEVSTGRVTPAGEWSSGTADYLLYVEISGAKEVAAVLEAKAAHRDPKVGAGQAREYARSIKAPFAFATNGHAFVEVDSDGNPGEQQPLDKFPMPAEVKQCHPLQQELDLRRQKEREEKERREREKQESKRRERENREANRKREAMSRSTTVPKASAGHQEHHNRVQREIWRDEAEQLRRDFGRGSGEDMPDQARTGYEQRQEKVMRASAGGESHTPNHRSDRWKNRRQPVLPGIGGSSPENTSSNLKRWQSAKRRLKGALGWHRSLELIGSIRYGRRGRPSLR